MVATDAGEAMTDELLKEYRRSIEVNITLSAKVDDLQKRLEAFEAKPAVDMGKLAALEKKIDEMILSMKVKR